MLSFFGFGKKTPEHLIKIDERKLATAAAASAEQLLKASQKGDAAEVTKLLDAGVYVHCKDNDGITPLLEACRKGHSSTAALLLDRGA